MQVKVSSQQYLAPSEEDVLDAYVMRMPDKNFSLPVSRRGEQRRSVVCNNSKGYCITHDVGMS
jgi:hypothetical protein